MSREFERQVGELGATVLRPARRDEPDNCLHLSSIRQRIESVFQTCKDILTLEPPRRARCLTSGRASGSRIRTHATCIYVNHRLGRPSRSLVAFAGLSGGINHLALGRRYG